MDCPQCGGTLATYALGGQEASVCEDCGYVGIPAEHRGEPRRIESWNDALRRFYRAHGTDEDPSVELRPPLSRPSDGSTESWADALRRFRERRTNGSAADEDESADEETNASTDGEDPSADAEESADEDDDTASANSEEPAETDAGADRAEPNAKAETGEAGEESASRPQSESQSQSQSSAGDS